jgi:hypothetical protein
MRKNKKGLTYLDWAISLGIFLIAFISIIIFLKPGTEKEFQSDDLFKIIESNFFEETTWSITSVPVAIKNLNITSEIILEHPTTSNWDFISPYNPQTTNLIITLVDLNKISITCDFEDCKTETSGEYQGVYINSLQDTSNPNKIFNMTDTSTGNSDYNIGSREVSTGLNRTSLDNLTNIELYSTTKTRWGYPEKRDFKINITCLDNSCEYAKDPDYNVDLQTSIFVKEIASNILETDGSRKPVKVRISIW